MSQSGANWSITSTAATTFSWDYSEGREKLVALYEKGKNKQWNASDRLDWSVPVDPANPLGIKDEEVPIFGSPTWAGLGANDRATLLHHLAAWQFSQFLHGEQAGVVCVAKIVQSVPDLDSKFYAATQVVDEARHAEVFSRFLREKMQVTYPINTSLKSLFNDIILDQRWDMTYLGVQVLIEGLALAAFGVVRDCTTNTLARALNAYVMEDEARHVAFGRLALRDHYKELSSVERTEREEFCIEATLVMRDRFMAQDVWATLGFDVDECARYVEEAPAQQAFRRRLFSRIVPSLKDIGLFSPAMRDHFAAMDVLEYETLDMEKAGRVDELASRMADAARRVQIDQAIQTGATADSGD